MGFYWSYILLLEPPFLCTLVSDYIHVSWFEANMNHSVCEGEKEQCITNTSVLCLMFDCVQY